METEKIIRLLRENAKTDLLFCPDLIKSHLSSIAADHLQELEKELGLCKNKLKDKKQLNVQSDLNRQITELRIESANDSQVIKSLRDRCEEYKQKMQIKYEENEKLYISLNDLQNSVDPLNERITDLKGQVSYMRGQRKDLEHTTDLLKNQVQNLLDKVKAYQTKENHDYNYRDCLKFLLEDNEDKIAKEIGDYEILKGMFFEIFGRPPVALKVNEIKFEGEELEKEYKKANFLTEADFFKKKLKNVNEVLSSERYKNFSHSSRVWWSQEKISVENNLERLEENLKEM